MPEEVQDVKGVDTTPAPEASTGQTITPPKDPEAYSKWRLTGDVPQKKKPPGKESAPSGDRSSNADRQSAKEDSDEGEEPDEEESEEKPAPAPEAGKKKQEQQQHYRKGSAQDRLDGLLADLRRAGLTPAELKTFRREAQQQQQAQPLPQTSVNPL